MSIKVNIPAPLRQYCDKKKEIEIEGDSITGILKELSDNYSLLYSKICDENGTLRQYVNIYVNGIDIKKQGNMKTPTKQGDVINIIPAVAGGFM